MPEHAEVHAFSEYFNSLTNGINFTDYRFLRVHSTSLALTAHKRPIITPPSALRNQFTMKSKARGKQFIMCLRSTTESKYAQYILLGFGLTGFISTAASMEEARTKQARIVFVGPRELVCICAEDVGSCYWSDVTERTRRTGTLGWDPQRGPDPVTEFPAFLARLTSGSLPGSSPRLPLSTSLCEALLDQRFFNGVGNYMRAEIVHRLGLPPFDPLRGAIASPGGVWRLAVVVRQVSKEARALVAHPEQFIAWLKVYGKAPNRAFDGLGRVMWWVGPGGRRAPRQLLGRGRRKHDPRIAGLFQDALNKGDPLRDKENIPSHISN
eukprot:gnl/Dysnectes_brevis/7738_a13279_176.p1 GENE.gnl/Dysnectes_brevis/7738_a13279_176~~gnl/Dysnectes_brevis/7738_a13279_176.p1  ORF type:complete len:324 (-),score=66.50 gnl/Dysnectes_brevis/7738_a13279_176:42-1013(-)